ncbi:MAG: hypothetical protein QXS23_04330 [Desulfurococcaceae archaeon]
MDLQSLLPELKNLIDSYEELLNKGKIILLSREFSIIGQFIPFLRKTVTNTYKLLPLVKSKILEQQGSTDKLYKYISTYYRMITLIDIPYLVSILKQIADKLEKENERGDYEQLVRIIDDIEKFMDTLKS